MTGLSANLICKSFAERSRTSTTVTARSSRTLSALLRMPARNDEASSASCSLALAWPSFSSALCRAAVSPLNALTTSSVLTAEIRVVVSKTRIVAQTAAGWRRDHLTHFSIEFRPAGLNRLVVEVAPQVVGQWLGRLVTASRFFADRLEHDGFQIERDSPVDLTRRLWILDGDAAEYLLSVAAGESRTQDQHFIERDSQRVHIRSFVEHTLPRGLLGTHVAAVFRACHP